VKILLPILLEFKTDTRDNFGRELRFSAFGGRLSVDKHFGNVRLG
jgi:hypothetical protein